MAANDTGEDITFGETNKGTDGTELIGDATSGGSFGNDYVLRVDSSPFINSRDVDGIRGVAHGHGRGILGQADGNAGVRGEGPTGVHGEGQGGAGIGVSGVSNGGVGVSGESATGVGVTGVSSGIGVSGTSAASVGVVGVSNGTGTEPIGVQGFADAQTGIGVQGSSSRGTGVFASSGEGTGLVASSTAGIAVNARSDGDRGGVFASTVTAQVRLIPHAPVEQLPTEPLNVFALNAKGHETTLPSVARIGDLFCTSMKPAVGADKPVGALWFCIRDGDATDPAHWCEVLLGNVFTGQG